MSSLHHALYSSWKCDRKILYIFALYGLAAGAVTQIAGLYNGDLFGGIALVANFPTIMTWYFTSGGYSPFPDVIRIPFSVAVWSFIGLMAYAIVKMFKMGP